MADKTPALAFCAARIQAALSVVFSSLLVPMLCLKILAKWAPVIPVDLLLKKRQSCLLQADRK